MSKNILETSISYANIDRRRIPYSFDISDSNVRYDDFKGPVNGDDNRICFMCNQWCCREVNGRRCGRYMNVQGYFEQDEDKINNNTDSADDYIDCLPLCDSCWNEYEDDLQDGHYILFVDKGLYKIDATHRGND